MERATTPPSPGRQRGITLLIALIALVAISLGGLALMRMVDAGIMISGNLAFKQTAAHAGDAGTEAAIEWIAANSDQLASDVAAAGYYATWRTGCDLLGTRSADPEDDVVWAAGSTPLANCGMVAAAVASDRLPEGYAATYVINRMCDSEGSPNDPSLFCSSYLSTSGGSGSTKGGASYGQMPLTGTSQQYYRITTRVVGPRNTESIVQAIVAF
ncbi:MAG: hypothetical protein LT103_17300 [Burkholderiaceae bacterium]|nr:hypothetical protein [Burkholderiaceae bacterium]